MSTGYGHDATGSRLRMRRHRAPGAAARAAGKAAPPLAIAGLLLGFPHPATTPRHVTVKAGDTLSGISASLWGNPGSWRVLYAANRDTITNPDDIFPGEILTIPASRPAAPAVTGRRRGTYQPRHAKPPVTVLQDDVTGGTLGCGGLEGLWEDAGGSAGEAEVAASVAMAESGGDQYALSPTDDYGYWQINGSWGPALATFNAEGNARAAVRISADGTDWDPWTTYTDDAYAGRC
jgi:Lysozyme like domain/LysM domain